MMMSKRASLGLLASVVVLSALTALPASAKVPDRTAGSPSHGPTACWETLRPTR